MKFPVATPLLTDEDRHTVTEVVNSGWISSSGGYVNKFAQLWAEIHNAQFAVPVTSGTAALEVAIYALDLPKGTEVILPASTIVSCVTAIVSNGLRPRYVDVDPNDWTLDVCQVESAINKNTSAILAVDLFGMPCRYPELKSLCDRHNLRLVADSAEAHGATIDGCMVSEFVDAVAFSFFANKHVTCGEGGMVLFNDHALYERARGYINLFFDKERSYKHLSLGKNYRLTNLQAALGWSQAMRLDHIIEQKRQIRSAYKNAMESLDIGLSFQPEIKERDNTFWMTAALFGDGVSIDDLRSRLANLGVETRPFFYPLNLQNFNSSNGIAHTHCPVAERIGSSGMYLPSGLSLTTQDIIEICELTAKCLD